MDTVLKLVVEIGIDVAVVNSRKGIASIDDRLNLPTTCRLAAVVGAGFVIFFWNASNSLVP